MKCIAPALLLLVMSCMACENKKQQEETPVTEQEKEEAPRDAAADSVEIRKTATDFYNWYNKNYTKFQDYPLYSGIKAKDAPPYKINWEEVERYQSYIRREVPALGEEFLVNQKTFLQQADSAFKVDKEDDIPYGFDYDWYTNSQEGPEYLLEEMNKASNTWNIAVNGDRATVKVTGFYDHRGKQERVTFLGLVMK